jgi:hypothetical protein
MLHMLAGMPSATSATSHLLASMPSADMLHLRIHFVCRHTSRMLRCARSRKTSHGRSARPYWSSSSGLKPWSTMPSPPRNSSVACPSTPPGPVQDTIPLPPFGPSAVIPTPPTDAPADIPLVPPQSPSPRTHIRVQKPQSECPSGVCCTT